MQTSRTDERDQPADALSIERDVRQLLADKISGSLLGLWLLAPEHLRLGTWDLLCRWAGDLSGQSVGPRLALHMVHEAALCRAALRADRSLRQNGFCIVNGLPWLPTDTAIHNLLESHTINDAQQLQVQLGKLRRASGHFPSDVFALDPHRMGSHTQREMPLRHGHDKRGTKQAQTFFVLDPKTRQPACLTNASNARALSSATEELLGLAAQILPAKQGQRLLLVGDAEHFSVGLFDYVRTQTPFDLLAPMRNTPQAQAYYRSLPPSAFTRHWAGFATATGTFLPRRTRCPDPCYRYIQRAGERPEEYHFKGFCCTRARPEVPTLTAHFPDRWHIEEFYRFEQQLGWKRAGTFNLHIRLGQMTMALVAQAVIHQLRQRLGAPYLQWDSPHFARDIFSGLEGDIRVSTDTVLITYYNAPGATQWKTQFEKLPERLQNEGVNPRVPWLYNFKLDFRFK